MSIGFNQVYSALFLDMPTYVLRVGQMSGDTVQGYWNLTEQYPLLVVGGAIHMKKVGTISSYK